MLNYAVVSSNIVSKIFVFIISKILSSVWNYWITKVWNFFKHRQKANSIFFEVEWKCFITTRTWSLFNAVTSELLHRREWTWITFCWFLLSYVILSQRLAGRRDCGKMMALLCSGSLWSRAGSVWAEINNPLELILRPLEIKFLGEGVLNETSPQAKNPSDAAVSGHHCVTVVNKVTVASYGVILLKQNVLALTEASGVVPL